VEIRDLEYLAASASAGNFARAAKALGCNTSTISRRIGRLEDELGLALFERGQAGVRLTAGGRAVMLHVSRALAELDAVRRSGIENSSGAAGEIQLGVRLPPIGEPIVSILGDWREKHPNVVLVVSEMNDRDLAAALEKRRLDVALTFGHAVWPHAESTPLYWDRLLAAVPAGHALAEQPSVNWDALRGEIILVQGWEESQAARELYASFLGDGAMFRPHAASKQSVLALVSAGFGITFATASQSKTAFPGVVFKPIDDPNASAEIVLAWRPQLEDATVGRFVAFLRDEARSRRLISPS
jgi:DNA-binding transcriptional LysR family regulator